MTGARNATQFSSINNTPLTARLMRDSLLMGAAWLGRNIATVLRRRYSVGGSGGGGGGGGVAAEASAAVV